MAKRDKILLEVMGSPDTKQIDGLGGAAVVPDSVVAQVLREGTDTQFIRIGHPGGILEAGVDYSLDGQETTIETAFGFRTANFLMDGVTLID